MTYPRITQKDYQRGEAHTMLMNQIITATDEGTTIPCLTDDWEAWTSPIPSERRKAVRACMQCPLITQCRAYADRWEESGVWGAHSLDRLRGEQTTLFQTEEVAAHAP